MEFSGLLFLYVMLPLILLGYFLLPDVGRRNMWLIGVSFLLYALIQPVYAVLLLIMSRYNFKQGLKVIRGHKNTLAIPVFVNLLPLLLLRYLDPVLLIAGIGGESGGVLLGAVVRAISAINQIGLDLPLPESIAPIGYGLFVLSAISYLADIYRGKYPAEKSFRNYLLYMIMFPKLFQGPLVRYDQIRVEIRERRNNEKSILEGAVRFATGLGKKVLIADFCGRMLQELAASGSDQALIGAWLRPVLMLFRIYYDLSAACDMSIGLGRIFGFRIPENFRLPFMAMSVTEFFEGWNLTVRYFFRDYVYIPICESKDGKGNKLIAGFAALMLMSLWHGGSLNFWLLGIFIGLCIVVERQAQDFLTDLPYWLRHVLTYFALLFCAVLFENRDSVEIASAVKAMIGEGSAAISGDGNRILNSIPLIGMCWIGVSALPRKFRMKWKRVCGIGLKAQEKPVHPLMPKVYWICNMIYVLVIFWFCTVARIGAPVVESVFIGL